MNNCEHANNPLQIDSANLEDKVHIPPKSIPADLEKLSETNLEDSIEVIVSSEDDQNNSLDDLLETTPEESIETSALSEKVLLETKVNIPPINKNLLNILKQKFEPTIIQMIIKNWEYINVDFDDISYESYHLSGYAKKIIRKSVERLHRTWRHVRVKERRILKELNDYISPFDNLKIAPQSPSLFQLPQQPLVNFQKHRTTDAIIKRVIAFQSLA
ncbi:15740_t:CDS:2, partial [Gigaspora margarita]